MAFTNEKHSHVILSLVFKVSANEEKEKGEIFLLGIHKLSKFIECKTKMLPRIA